MYWMIAHNRLYSLENVGYKIVVCGIIWVSVMQRRNAAIENHSQLNATNATNWRIYIMSNYSINAVSSLTSDVEKQAVVDNVSIIKFKNKEKKGYYFTAPAITANFVAAFVGSKEGIDVIAEYIDTLRKEVAKSRFDSGQYFSEADCTIANLIEFAQRTSENVRLTEETLTKAFNADWLNTIAYGLVLERDAGGAAILLGEDEQAKLQYWLGEAGQTFKGIAKNYLQFFLRAAKRNNPTFETQEIADKVCFAASLLNQEDMLVKKLVTKLGEMGIGNTISVDL